VRGGLRPHPRGGGPLRGGRGGAGRVERGGSEGGFQPRGLHAAVLGGVRGGAEQGRV